MAENGRQAIDELERRPVDLLISDIHMPDMTGSTCCARRRR